MEIVLLAAGKVMGLLKIIALPFFLLFAGKSLNEYNDWFHEHYTNISTYTVGSFVAIFTPLQIHSPLFMFTYSLVELIVKTCIAVTITFFLNKALKNYASKNKTNEDIDKMDKKQ